MGGGTTSVGGATTSVGGATPSVGGVKVLVLYLLGILVTFSFLIYLSQLRDVSSTRTLVAVSNVLLAAAQDRNSSYSPYRRALRKLISGPGRPEGGEYLSDLLRSSVVRQGTVGQEGIVTNSTQSAPSQQLNRLLRKISNVRIMPSLAEVRSNRVDVSVSQSTHSTLTPDVPLFSRTSPRLAGTSARQRADTFRGVQRFTAVPPVQSGWYITFGGGFADGRGLGNQLFNIAAAVYVAVLSGREFIMEKMDFVQGVDQVFELSVTRMTKSCPCIFFAELLSLAYDPRVEDIGQQGHFTSSKKTVLLIGYYQSWKYTRNIEKRLRDMLKFKPEVKSVADKFLHDNYPPGWTNAFVRVAIHIRRGDYLNPDKQKYGYSVPNATYFNRAMKYFTTNYGRVQFIAVSQDSDWTKNNIKAPGDIPQKEVNVTYSFGKTAGQDMALMSSCDHVIMSSGTFGWWAGFLGKGTTVYYSDWPKPGTDLYRTFRKEEFYPPAWIGMHDRETG